MQPTRCEPQVNYQRITLDSAHLSLRSNTLCPWLNLVKPTNGSRSRARLLLSRDISANASRSWWLSGDRCVGLFGFRYCWGGCLRRYSSLPWLGSFSTEADVSDLPVFSMAQFPLCS